MGPRAGVDGLGKSLPPRNSTPGPFSPKRVAITTELPGTLRKPNLLLTLSLFHTPFSAPILFVNVFINFILSP